MRRALKTICECYLRPKRFAEVIRYVHQGTLLTRTHQANFNHCLYKLCILSANWNRLHGPIDGSRWSTATPNG
ncbi:unnamed protein product [Ixodes pacificus]